MARSTNSGPSDEVKRRISLQERYGALRWLAWVDVVPGEVGGPVFEWIDGHTPGRLEDWFVEPSVRAVRALHGDTGLRDALERAGDTVRSCADAYLGSYHDRFTEDFDFIAAEPPPFVDDGLVAWMRDEATERAGIVGSLAAFDEPASFLRTATSG